MKRILKILPYYEPRMWKGGTRLEEEFGYKTDVQPLGEVYNVVALKGHADCEVPQMNMTLSELYERCPDWFECETKELPVRVNILDPIDSLSVQIHPDDDFARESDYSHRPASGVLTEYGLSFKRTSEPSSLQIRTKTLA